jgi:general secretion pathway protein L
MAETLLLRLPRAADEAASWLIVDGRGAPVGPPQSGPLNLAAPRVAGRRVCVLVPGAEVLLAEPDLPPKAGAKLAQLVPYALEEHLADSIEDLHFAIGKRSLETARVRAAGIAPDALHADSDLLPQNPGQAVALMEADAVFVRAPGASPVTLPADALGQALEIAQSGTDTASGARGLILYTGAAEWQQHAAQVEAVRAHFDGIKVQLLTGGPLALFAQQLPAATAINLLQGEYAPESGRAIGWQAWRVAALLLAGLVALHLVGKATQLHFLKTREHQVDVSIREAVRAAMPGEPNLLDARKRMEQRLAVARGASSGLLPALQALAQAGAVVPGTRLQSVNFKNGAVEMKLSAPDAASLDHLNQALRSNGWQADLLGGTNNGQGYEGRIQVHGNGG